MSNKYQLFDRIKTLQASTNAIENVDEVRDLAERLLSNPILMADSYKITHDGQTPDNTQYITSYIEARGGTYDYTVMYGLQIFLIKVLSKRLTREMVEDAKEFLIDKGHMGRFNYDGFMDIVTKLDGKWPVEIKAVPEGFKVNKKIVLVSITNTDPRFAWVTSYLETCLLRAVWYASTIATKSYSVRSDIMGYLKGTCEDPESAIDFMFLDFGARGVSSGESAQIGGSAHLAMGWMGSDTMEGVQAFNLYYNIAMSAFSVVASEHSTMTIWEEKAEAYAIGRLIEKFGYNEDGTGNIVSVVLDSYDYWRALEEYVGIRYNAEIRKLGAAGGRFVCRPDSGNPVKIMVKSLQILYKKFEDDCSVNKLGYKVLPPYLRVLFADGIDETDIIAICEAVMEAGFSVENILFGMDGGLLQSATRDDCGFAMKACSATIAGEQRDVHKNPKTAKGFKASKRGEYTTILLKQSGNIESIPIHGENVVPLVDYVDILFPVYRDGEVILTYSAEEVRGNVSLFV